MNLLMTQFDCPNVTILQRQRWEETSERRGGAHVGFSKHIDTILNRIELTLCG